jgi:hypothetical protein
MSYSTRFPDFLTGGSAQPLRNGPYSNRRQAATTAQNPLNVSSTIPTIPATVPVPSNHNSATSANPASTANAPRRSERIRRIASAADTPDNHQPVENAEPHRPRTSCNRRTTSTANTPENTHPVENARPRRILTLTFRAAATASTSENSYPVETARPSRPRTPPDLHTASTEVSAAITHADSSAAPTVNGTRYPGSDTTMPDQNESGIPVPGATEDPDFHIGDSGSEESDNNQAINTSVSRPERPIQEPTKSGRKRKRQPVAKAVKATARKVVSKEANSMEADSRMTNGSAGDLQVDKNLAKGSAKALKVPRFATRAYKETRSVFPFTRLFKLEADHEADPDIGTSKDGISSTAEVSDLLGVIDKLLSPSSKSFFYPREDTREIDEKIVLGLKLRQKEDEDEDVDPEEPGQRFTTQENPDKLFAYNGLNEHLKPLSDIHEIFSDLTENALLKGLPDFLKAIKSGSLKVSTLCSGTESPLLAMQMIQDSA